MVESPDGQENAGKAAIEAGERAQGVPCGGSGEGLAKIGAVPDGNEASVFGRFFFEGAEPIAPRGPVAGQRGIAFAQETFRGGGRFLFCAINESVARGRDGWRIDWRIFG